MEQEIYSIGPSSIKLFKAEPIPIALLYQMNSQFISHNTKLKIYQLKMISDRVIEDHYQFINGGVKILNEWESKKGKLKERSKGIKKLLLNSNTLQGALRSKVDTAEELDRLERRYGMFQNITDEAKDI